MFRVDFGSARILLTGDLNKVAQEAYMYEIGVPSLVELQADVAKGCHHGAEDVSFAFLQAIRPSATVISSGDNEGHGHPRPSIVAASAVTGNPTFDNQGNLLTPLIYSTEIARSVRLAEATQLDVPPAQPGGQVTTITGEILRNTDVTYNERSLFGGGAGTRPFSVLPVVPGIIYGLVNVRTDGTDILCATREESGGGWHVSKFPARF